MNHQNLNSFDEMKSRFADFTEDEVKDFAVIIMAACQPLILSAISTLPVQKVNRLVELMKRLVLKDPNGTF